MSDVTVMGFNYTEEAALTCSQNVQDELGAAAGEGRGGGPSPSCPCSQVAAARPLHSVQSALMPPSPSGPQSAPPGVFSALLQRTVLCPPGTCRVWWQRATAGKPAKSAGAPGTLPGLSGAGSQCAPAADALFFSGGAKRRVHSRVWGLHVPPGSDPRRRGGPRFAKGVVLGGSFVRPSAHALKW